MFASSANLSKRRWLDLPVNTQGKINKTKTNTRLKWPIFDEMAKAEHDPFWQKLWIRASKSKFSPGFTFNGKELSYSYRKKVSKVNLSTNIIDSCQLAKHMYQECSSIFSPLDLKRINHRKDIAYNNRVNEITSWAKCKEPQRNTLITHFLLELVKEFRLSPLEKNELHQTINVGVNIGAFNDSNIVISNNKIDHIIGLEWNDQTEKFYIDTDKAPFKIKKQTKTKPKLDNSICLYSSWIKLTTPKVSTKGKVTEILIGDIANSVSASVYNDD